MIFFDEIINFKYYSFLRVFDEFVNEFEFWDDQLAVCNHWCDEFIPSVGGIMEKLLQMNFRLYLFYFIHKS